MNIAFRRNQPRCVWVVAAAGVAFMSAPEAAAQSSVVDKVIPDIPAPEVRDPLPERNTLRFVADPITDGAIISLSLGFAAVLEFVVSTEELTPQQPGPTDKLLGIDRGIVGDEPNQTAVDASNFGLYGALGFALVDSIESGFRYKPSAGLVDFTMYLESISLSWAAANLAKLAVRRPRPNAYQERDRRVAAGLPLENESTESALSFFSGHSAIVGSVAATATYLGFARSESPLRGYLTLFGGLGVTSMVAWGRVKGRKHFPTDVIAGAVAGIGIGTLVPHMHREAEVKERPVWIGGAPPGGDWGATLNGTF